MKECLQRLKKHKAKLCDDDETLRAFLLVAIQDDDFDSVRDTILAQPPKTIEQLLTEIRKRDSTLQLKDGARPLLGDGTTTSRRVSGSIKPSSHVRTAMSSGKWVIPTFPPGWKDAIGHKIFKIMVDWHKAAIHDHSLQKSLDSNFALRTDNVSGKHPRRKARKASAKDDDDDAMDEDIDMDDGDNGKKKNPKRRRVTLQKSRRVVTETGKD